MERVTNALLRLRSVSAWDIVDLLVLIFLIYRALLLVRGTRAEQVAKGVALLTIFYFLSQPLRTVHWLMRSLMIPGVLVMVVIFQPELRMVLERVGRRGPFAMRSQPLPGEQIQHVINEISEALARFSRYRIGALIVWEREQPLQDVAQTGVPMHAEISSTLLESIFYAGAPLHDGAALIRGDRLVAAACLLPTTTTPRVGRGFGLRHLAAIGMSERSDAVIVVVSEETGNISIAADGVLDTKVDLADVKERLLTYFSLPARAPWFSFIFGGRR